MKNTINIFLLLFCSCFFLACPYESNVPIDVPSVPLDQKLLGTWKKINAEDDIYVVSAKDQFSFLLDKKEKNESETRHYIAFESQVNGIRFLNITEIDSIDVVQKYLLYKISQRADSIVLSEVTDNIDEQFANSNSLKKFISANMHNSYFFNKEENVFFKLINEK